MARVALRNMLLRRLRSAQGIEHFQSERYAEAIRLFDQSLAINERHMAPSALGLCTNLNNLASAYDKLGQAQSAVYFYERAVGVINHPSASWDEQRRRARDHVMGKLGRMTQRGPDGVGEGEGEEEAEATLLTAQRVAAVMWEEVSARHAPPDPRQPHARSPARSPPALRPCSAPTDALGRSRARASLPGAARLSAHAGPAAVRR
jgi:tetratricopeptide (TPR) repeat protein